MGNSQSFSYEARMTAPDILQKHSDGESDTALVSTQSHSAHSASSDCPVIRQLVLHHSAKLDDVMFLVEKGWILRFICGPSLCNVNVRLFIDCQSVGIEDEQYPQEVTWNKRHFSDFGSFADAVQLSADFQATVAGSFHYFFTVDGSSQPEDASGRGYFIVQPKLKVRNLKTDVSLQSIVCQTVLSKNMGPFSGWLERLLVAKKSGYNAVHFTPVQVSDYILTLLFIRAVTD